MVQVREKTLEEIKLKLQEMKTDLNKINYLEDALKEGFTFEIKRLIWGELSELYEERKMYDKSAKAMANKAGVEVLTKDKIESYLKAAELYSKSGRVEDADDMFIRATRAANFEQKQNIKLARKNIMLVNASELEKKGKRASALKFYEKLIKMDLEEIEKEEVKEKLVSTYKTLGKFKEIELLEGM